MEINMVVSKKKNLKLELSYDLDIPCGHIYTGI
jgi:hypothetical protein